MLAIVAGSKTHAQATIKWLELDAKRCVPLAYGEHLEEDRYELAMLVRPTEGTTPAQREWICTELLPRVDGPFRTHPEQWKPYHDEGPIKEPVAEGAPEIEENPLWA